MSRREHRICLALLADEVTEPAPHPALMHRKNSDSAGKVTHFILLHVKMPIGARMSRYRVWIRSKLTAENKQIRWRQA